MYAYTAYGVANNFQVRVKLSSLLDPPPPPKGAHTSFWTRKNDFRLAIWLAAMPRDVHCRLSSKMHGEAVGNGSENARRGPLYEMLITVVERVSVNVTFIANHQFFAVNHSGNMMPDKRTRRHVAIKRHQGRKFIERH